MDRSRGRGSSLRRPFATTANALTTLYKTAVTAERDARAAGERAAYLSMLEWAARRSTAGMTVGAGDLAQFASERLASGAPLAEAVARDGDSGGGGSPRTVGDDVARSIGELRVRPRKRARADMGDVFLQVLKEDGELSGEESEGGGDVVVGVPEVIGADTEMSGAREISAARKVAAKRAHGGIRGPRRRDGDGNGF